MTPVLITINGTGDPDPLSTAGFSGMLGSMVGTIANPWQPIANQLMGLATGAPPWIWQPIGYPAAVVPMNPSVQNARQQVVAALGGPASAAYGNAPVYAEGPFALSGYSQGAIASSTVWAQDILAPGGVLHHRLPDCLSVINFGDPFRCPGVANGNTLQGIPVPGTLDGAVTGGISGPLDLTAAQTNKLNSLGQPVVMSYALPGDLYASAPVGANPWTAEAQAGKVGTSIYNVVLNGSFISVLEIAKDLLVPLGAVEEIINGMVFAAAGMNAPHWQYANKGCVAAAASYLVGIANQLP
jgi:hypothetical protein